MIALLTKILLAVLPDFVTGFVGNFGVGLSNRVIKYINGKTKRKESVVVDWSKVCKDMLYEQNQLTSNKMIKPYSIRQAVDIFVEPRVIKLGKPQERRINIALKNGSPLSSIFYIEKTQQLLEKEEPIDANRFLLELEKSEKSKRIILIGEPGAGKTTFLQRVAFWLLDNTEHLVVWVPLRKLKGRTIVDYIRTEWMSAAVIDTEKAIIDLENQISQKKVWILLDGFDEISQESRAALSFNGWISKSNMIVTCRTNFDQESLLATHSFERYEILGFNQRQIKSFIQKWFSESKKPENDKSFSEASKIFLKQADEAIKEIAKNPLRLALLCSAWQSEGSIPKTSGKLYEQFVSNIYKWRRDASPIYRNKKEALNERLGEISLKAISQDKNRFMLTENYLFPYLGDPIDCNSLFNSVLQVGLLKKIGIAADNTEEPVYVFSYTTLQEYFAARYLLDKSSYDELARHILEDNWYSIIQIATELVQDAGSLFLSIKNEIDAIVRRDPKIQELLKYISQKTATFTDDSIYSASSIRALYFSSMRIDKNSINSFDLDMSRNLARALDSDIVDNFLETLTDLHRFGTTITTYGNSTINYIAADLSLQNARRYALTFDDACKISRELKVEYKIAIEKNDWYRAEEIKRDYGMDLCDDVRDSCKSSLRDAISLSSNTNKNLENALKSLNDCFDNVFGSDVHENRVEWSCTIQDIMLVHFHTVDSWDFTDQQKQDIKNYYKANINLAMLLRRRRSLRSGYSLTTVEKSVEDSILLPTA